MDFAADTDLIQAIIDELDKTISEVESYSKGGANSIIDAIQAMHDNGDWTGAAMNTFFDGCESFAPSIDALAITLRAFKALYENVLTEAGTLESDVASALTL